MQPVAEWLYRVVLLTLCGGIALNMQDAREEANHIRQRGEILTNQLVAVQADVEELRKMGLCDPSVACTSCLGAVQQSCLGVAGCKPASGGAGCLICPDGSPTTFLIEGDFSGVQNGTCDECVDLATNFDGLEMDYDRQEPGACYWHSGYPEEEEFCGQTIVGNAQYLFARMQVHNIIGVTLTFFNNSAAYVCDWDDWDCMDGGTLTLQFNEQFCGDGWPETITVSPAP